MHSRPFHVASLLLLGSATLSCGLFPTGTRDNSSSFQVEMALRSDTCGPRAVPVPASLRFRALLKVQGQQASWKIEGTNAAAAGAYDPTTGAFRFEVSESFVQRAGSATFQRAACVLQRVDILQGTLTRTQNTFDAGSDAQSDASGDAGSRANFSATETVLYGVVAGADCSDQIGVGQGQFLVLPCQQTFALTGSTQ